MAIGNPSPIMTPIVSWINVYSLQPWAELKFPDRSIEFESLAPKKAAPSSKPDVLVIGVRNPMMMGRGRRG